MPTCKESHQLVAEGMDRDLNTVEKIGLRLHLSMCGACTRFAEQMRLIRQAMQSIDLNSGDDVPAPRDTQKP